MRKIVILLVLILCLSGCAAAPTFETLGPVAHQPDQFPAIASVQLDLPESATAQTFGAGADTFYECDGYTLVMQTQTSGDFYHTLRSLSGFTPEKLTVMESIVGQTHRYDWVWSAAAEEGEMICRAAVLDDGNYHYCLYTLAPAHLGSELTEEWNMLFASFCLGSTE